MTRAVPPAARRAASTAPLAGFLSFVFPGLGQAYNGQLRLALMLALPILLLAVAAFLAVSLARSTLFAELLDRRFIIGLIVLDVAVLGWRLIAVAQAHGWRSRISLRHWTGWVTGLLLLAVVGMHVLPAYYAIKTIDTLGAVAWEGSGVSHGGVGGVGGLGRVPGSTPLPAPSEQPDVRGGERVNILLVGVDSGPGRQTALTDTMLVVSIDSDGGRSVMISVPRDLYGTPLPDGRVYNAKLNSLMAFASARPTEFPDGGVGTLKGAVGELLGVKIHYFGAINLLGFKQAIDAIGGVEVSVGRPISDPTYVNEYGVRTGLFLSTGSYHMDGGLALAYARSRKGAGDNDFTRAERQQQLLTAIREKLTAGNLILSLPGLLDAVRNTISTDVPADRLSELAAAVQEMDVTRLRRVVLQPPALMYAASSPTAGFILVPDLEAIRKVARDLLTDRPAPPGDDPSAGS